MCGVVNQTVIRIAGDAFGPEHKMALRPQTHTLCTGFPGQPMNWLVVLFLLSASCALAQAPARTVPVTGTVLDPSGAGAAGMTVNLKKGVDTVLASAETDSAGRF